MKKPRVQEIDFLRAVAIILVVVLHVSAAFMMNSPEKGNAFFLGLILNQWSRICLPLFVFVSGFGLFYRYGRGENIDYKGFYGKRLFNVFLPYAFWSLIYIILRNIFNKTFDFFRLPPRDLLSVYLQWTFWENIHITLWFVLMITQFYLLFPLMRKMVLNVKRPAWVITVQTFIYFTLTIYLVGFRVNTGFVVIDFIQNYYNVNFLGWYYYFILGGIAAVYWDSLKEFRWNNGIVAGAYVITTLSVVLEAYFGYLNYGRPYLESYTSLRGTVLLNSLAALPAMYILGKRCLKHEGLSELILKISRYSYGIYFVHPQVLTTLKILMGRVLGTYTARMSHFVILLSLTLSLSYIFCYIVDKTPLRKTLLGVSRK